MSEGLDTALARLLDAQRALPRATLIQALAAARARRGPEGDDLSLALQLLEQRLLSPERLERALSEIGEAGAGLLSEAPALPIGQAELGDYRVLRELARGGMGAVYEVEHRQTQVRYALKRTFPISDAEERVRLAREAQVLASLRHPGLVRVHSADLDRPDPYFVLELLPGGSLADRLRGGPLPLADALRVTEEIGAALGYLHEQGVLHRDLKPANVLFDEAGRARLGDFGIARQRGSLSLTRTGEILGTPAFMPPEQIEDSRRVDARSDVYALGALLYTMLSGGPPFRGASAIQVMDRVLRVEPAPLSDAPAGLAQACARALAKDPDQRPASVAEFLALTREGVQVARPWAWVLGLLGALLLVGLPLALGRTPSAQAPPPAPQLAREDEVRASPTRAAASPSERSSDPLCRLPQPWRSTVEDYDGAPTRRQQDLLRLALERTPALRRLERDARVLQRYGGLDRYALRGYAKRERGTPREQSAAPFLTFADGGSRVGFRRLGQFLLPQEDPGLRLLAERLLGSVIVNGDARPAEHLALRYKSEEQDLALAFLWLSHHGGATADARLPQLLRFYAQRALPDEAQARALLEPYLVRIWREPPPPIGVSWPPWPARITSLRAARLIEAAASECPRLSQMLRDARAGSQEVLPSFCRRALEGEVMSLAKLAELIQGGDPTDAERKWALAIACLAVDAAPTVERAPNEHHKIYYRYLKVNRGRRSLQAIAATAYLSKHFPQRVAIERETADRLSSRRFSPAEALECVLEDVHQILEEHEPLPQLEWRAPPEGR